MKSVAQLASELNSIAGETIDCETAQKALEMMSSFLQERYRVSYDEIAIFRLVDGDHLAFVVPRELANKGTIPVNANQSVAAKTVTTVKASCFNDFQTQRHITFFEGIKFAPDIKGLIQRMLCVPVVLNKNVIGVIQVSRKGPDLMQCGPPFGQSDLEDLVLFCQSAAAIMNRVFNAADEETCEAG